MAAAGFTAVRQVPALKGKSSAKSQFREPPRGVLYSVTPTKLQFEVSQDQDHNRIDPQVNGESAIEASSCRGRVGEEAQAHRCDQNPIFRIGKIIECTRRDGPRPGMRG